MSGASRLAATAIRCSRSCQERLYEVRKRMEAVEIWFHQIHSEFLTSDFDF